MATRMLIDARHPEETRVAVLKGNRIDEFDFESADRKQIKGNIYLAKVTRVEPSLQAAFVDFGGNRHGFLAFSEIHPDYYQIPREDREALLAEEAAHAEEEAALRSADESEDGDDEDEDRDEDITDEEDDDGDDDDNDNEDDDGEDGDGGLTEVDTSEKDEVSTIEDGNVENGDDDETSSGNGNGRNNRGKSGQRGRRRQGQGRGRTKAADEVRAKRMALRRRYKIQDVIQRRQVLLVQVVKEERGNKGAALTSYLSLAGRYCVLMPNSSHGGGISRKISSVSDRKRLKAIINEMNLPKSMGCIVRTAGLSRTKTEIKRDFDYLARLWDELRETTLKSSAPTLIHSDSDLIKRAIRDIYNREIEEVVVEGEDGYRAAKSFMKLLMPSHARRVKPYSDPVPLFQRYGAEDQLTAMYDPVVQLKSGGYIVINPTEALVSIDINSGRSTKEHGIEATALNTNLEAAREVARQLRLRDMAGLVVIDFIDMEYGSNVRKVEKAMKDALKSDRARIQVGRISSFGLMEMSRQRLRTGVLEATTRGCPHCDGTGLVRTASSAGLSALRQIEDEAAKGKGSVISLYASTEAAVYLLNAKRSDLADIETRYGVDVEVIPEGEDEGAKMRVGSSGPPPENKPDFQPIIDDEEDDDEEEEITDIEEDEDEQDSDSPRRKRRKRRRGRGRDRQDENQSGESADDSAADDSKDSDEDSGKPSADNENSDDSDTPRKRRRRGGRRRRGRNRDGEGENQVAAETGEEGDSAAADQSQTEQSGSDGGVDSKTSDQQAEQPAQQSESKAEVEPSAEAETEAKPKRRRAPRAKPAAKAAAAKGGATGDTPEGAESAEEDAPAPKPKRTRRKKTDAEPAASTDGEADATTDAPAKPKRTRRKKADAEPAASTDGKAEATTEAPAKPKRTRRKKADATAEETAAPAEQSPGAAEAADEPAPAVKEPVAAVNKASAGDKQTQEADADGGDQADDGQPRRGWWQRTFGA